MDFAPSSPWRAISERDHGFQTETPYDGTALGMFADIYFAGAQVGFSPLDIDEMEIWQVAAAFGADYERSNDGNDSGQNRVASNQRNLLEERVAHHKGEGPKPEASRPGADVLNLMRTLKAKNG